MFGGFFALAHPAYETNDDVGMMGIASGLLFHEPSEALVYTHVLIGSMLKHLYMGSHAVNWYSLYLYTIHFLCFSVLVCIFFQRMDSGLTLFIRLQFTTTAFVALVSGVLLILHLSRREKNRPYPALLLGVLLMVLGTMVREEVLYLVLLLSGPLLLLQFFKHRSVRMLIFTGMALVLSLAAVGYDRIYYAQDEEWRDFLEYNRSRESIHGRPVPDQNHAMDRILEEIGWSQNDARMFYSWFFPDPQIYSEKNLTRFLSHTSKRIRNTSQTWDYLFSRLQGSHLYLYFTLLNLIICLLLMPQKKRAFLIQTGVLVLPAAGICCFLSATLRLPERVFLPILFFINIVILFMASDEEKNRYSGASSSHARYAPYAKGILFTAVFLLIIQVGLAHWRNLSATNHMNVLRHQAFEELINDLLTKFGSHGTKQPVFVAVGAAFPYEWAPPFSDFSRFRRVHLLPFGWNTHSPMYKAMLKRHGIDNVYRALYERPEMRLICPVDFPGHLRLFLKEHYGKETQFEDQTQTLTQNSPLIRDHIRRFGIYKGQASGP